MRRTNSPSLAASGSPARCLAMAVNQYTMCKIMDALYGRDVNILNTRVASAGERGLDRIGYMGVAEHDPMTRRGWQFLTFNSYGGITYDKTALVLLTLEHIIGEEKV